MSIPKPNIPYISCVSCVEQFLTLENISTDLLEKIKQLPLEIKLKEISSECYEANLCEYTHEYLAKLLEALNNIGIAFLYKWCPANIFSLYQGNGLIPFNAFKIFHQALDGIWIIEEKRNMETLSIQREKSKPDIPYISSCEEFLVLENVSNDILEKMDKYLLYPKHWYSIFFPIGINQIKLKKKGECYQADLRKYTDKDRAKLLDVLNGVGFAFLYEYCPSTIFEVYRSEGLISGTFKLIFQNAHDSWIINEK